MPEPDTTPDTFTVAHRPASGGSTFAHTGPADACTLPECATTPDSDQAARWARREPLLVLISRMQRGVLGRHERDLLRAAVETELADGDQAREQLAEARAGDAPWIKAYGEDIGAAEQRAANAEAEQSQLCARLADRTDELAHALGRDRCGDNWEELIEIAAGLPAADRAARDARRGEREAVRARKAAETRAQGAADRADHAESRADHAEERLRLAARVLVTDGYFTADDIGPDIAPRLTEWLAHHHERAERASRRAARYAERLLTHRAEARRNRDAWRNARRRAVVLSAEVTRRAPLLGEYAARALAAERAAKRAEKRCEDLRGESLRRGKEVVERNERIAKLERRAEQAEATLTAIAKVAFDAEVAHSVRLSQIRNLIDPADQKAALGDPQPATTEAGHEHGWAPVACRRMDTRTCPPSGPCPGPCARFESDDPTPWEQPAEPEPLDGAALWAAIRDHAARDLNWWDAIRHRLGEW